MLSRWSPVWMSSGGGVAAWVYDSIIYSGVNRRGRDVHCIVAVLGKSSHAMTIIVACKDLGEGMAQTLLITEPQGHWPACYVRLITRVSRRNA